MYFEDNGRLQVLLDYAVPIAFVNGDKLADLALEFELEQQPTAEELISVLVNQEDVETILKTPVSLPRYKYMCTCIITITCITGTVTINTEIPNYLFYQ